jgi:hypothetical protein
MGKHARLSLALAQADAKFAVNHGTSDGNGRSHFVEISDERLGGRGWMPPRLALAIYFPPPSTCKLFFTEKTFDTPLARRFARFLSASLSTTPSSVTFPFFTMI